MDLYNSGTQDQMMAYFITKVKQRLHIILAMSPTGSALVDRIRNFPSLVNCCTIDWFSRWPEEALEAVAKKFLYETNLNDAQIKNIVVMCKTYHMDAIQLSNKFVKEQKRQVYVTPTSYLDLIKMF